MSPKNSGPIIEITDDESDNFGEDDGPKPSPDGGPSCSGIWQQECPVTVVEHPVKEYRFRYGSESRTNGAIEGVNSTSQNTTYPTIRVDKYEGPVVIRVSCVCADNPYKPHPHKIVGPDKYCKDDVYTLNTIISEKNRIVVLKYFGIQCTTRKKIDEALQNRQQTGVDPFNTGNAYNAPVDLHHLRLAIEVFIPDAKGCLKELVGVVVTNVITDQPTQLSIIHKSHEFGSAHGDTQITMLTIKLPNETLWIRFYDPSTGWEKFVSPMRVYKLLSIVVNTPEYDNPDIEENVLVEISIWRERSDGSKVKYQAGPSSDFVYTPGPDPKTPSLLSKRQRTDQKQVHSSLLDDADLGDNSIFEDRPQTRSPQITNMKESAITIQSLDQKLIPYILPNKRQKPNPSQRSHKGSQVRCTGQLSPNRQQSPLAQNPFRKGSGSSIRPSPQAGQSIFRTQFSQTEHHPTNNQPSRSRAFIEEPNIFRGQPSQGSQSSVQPQRSQAEQNIIGSQHHHINSYLRQQNPPPNEPTFLRVQSLQAGESPQTQHSSTAQLLDIQLPRSEASSERQNYQAQLSFIEGSSLSTLSQYPQACQNIAESQNSLMSSSLGSQYSQMPHSIQNEQNVFEGNFIEIPPPASYPDNQQFVDGTPQPMPFWNPENFELIHLLSPSNVPTSNPPDMIQSLLDSPNPLTETHPLTHHLNPYELRYFEEPQEQQIPHQQQMADEEAPANEAIALPQPPDFADFESSLVNIENVILSLSDHLRNASLMSCDEP